MTAVGLSPDTPQFLLVPETLPVQERLNLTVVGTGVRMPPVRLAVAPPPVYVPPQRPRKPDRN